MKAVFTIRNDWVGRTITCIDKGPFNHCGIYEPAHDSTGGFIIEAMPFKGVRKKPLGPLLDEVEGFAIVELKDLPQEYIAKAWLDQQIGRRYDWRGLLGIAFGANWTNEEKWVCAPLTLMTFIMAGASLSNGPQPGFDYAVGVREAFDVIQNLGGVITKLKLPPLLSL